MSACSAPRSIWIPLAFWFASILALPITAQDKPALSVAALTPEVQTAEWAKAWWMPRHTDKLKEKETLQHVDMIWIGDSITHGWGALEKPPGTSSMPDEVLSISASVATAPSRCCGD